MKKNTKILLLLVLVVVFASILHIWLNFSPTVAVYRLIHERDTESRLAYAFTIALITNHSAAYDMIDPSLKPRLDEWTNAHQTKKCADLPELFLIGSDTTGEYNVSFGCHGINTNGWIGLEIENIVISDMKVIDWGEVKEED